MARKDRGGGLEGIALGLLSILVCQYLRLRRKKLKYQDAYWAERRGRSRVEKEMKKIANIRLNKDEGFFVQPIGFISSCYRQCVGTPRQGMLVPHSRSSITLTKNMSGEALDGLEEFSHVWITFQFHLNSNTLKEANAFSNRATFQAKINPPMLKGIKLGVLATRSPHRPNPIGVTLAQVRSIDKKNRTLYLNACDLVEGTPVLDVKVRVQKCVTFIHKFIYLVTEYSHMFQLMTPSLSFAFQLGFKKRFSLEMKLWLIQSVLKL